MKQSPKNLSVGFLFDDTLDSNDGVAQYVKNLGTWLSARGHKVSFLVGNSKTQSWASGKVYALSRNLPIAWAGNRLSISLLPKLKEMNRLLKDNHFDILHVQVPYSPFMSQLVINKVPLDTAVVGTFHVYPANKLALAGSKLLKVVYGKSLRRFSTVLSVSPAAADYARRGFMIDCESSSNVVELDRFKIANQSPQPNHIVFLGRLVKRKGCYQLLQAFKNLINEIPDARLTIAGDGPMRPRLETYAKKNKLEKFVSFLGQVAEADKPKILASAQVASFPSMYGESFGIVLIEAMAAGAGVVIGGNNPGYRSVLGDSSETVFDPRDINQFTATLLKFLTDKDLLDKNHAWQQARVKQYDIKVVGPKIEVIYRQAIAKNQRSRHN